MGSHAHGRRIKVCRDEVYIDCVRGNRAKCEKLITMSLSHVSAFLSHRQRRRRRRRRKSLYAWPVTRHHLYSLSLSLYRSQYVIICHIGVFHSLPHWLTRSFAPSLSPCPAHHFIVIIFPLHHYRFFIVSPSGCSHQEHNDVIYEYVCTDCVYVSNRDMSTHAHSHASTAMEFLFLKWDYMFELLA